MDQCIGLGTMERLKCSLSTALCIFAGDWFLGRGGIAIQIEHHSFFLEMGSEIEHRSLASLVWV